MDAFATLTPREKLMMAGNAGCATYLLGKKGEALAWFQEARSMMLREGEIVPGLDTHAFFLHMNNLAVGLMAMGDEASAEAAVNTMARHGDEVDIIPGGIDLRLLREGKNGTVIFDFVK